MNISDLEQTLREQPQSALAHYNLAYELDRQAVNPQRVEALYNKAVDLEPSNPQNWLGQIQFEITRARFLTARKTWDRAKEALAPHSQADLYPTLHRDIARILLECSTLDFASDILLDVTDPAVQNAPWYNAEVKLLRYLMEAEENHLLFPLIRLHPVRKEFRCRQ